MKDDKLWFIDDILKEYAERYGEEEAALAKDMYWWFVDELLYSLRHTNNVAFKIPKIGRINLTGYTASNAVIEAESNVLKSLNNHWHTPSQKENLEWARGKVEEITRRKQEQTDQGLRFKQHWLFIKRKPRKYLLNGDYTT